MQTAFRRAMIDLDVSAARACWAAENPHLPQPANDAEALTTLHVARTAASSVPLKARMWSHCWLKERGYPSQLPDPLKPHAERMYPRQVAAVGVCVRSKIPYVRDAIRGVMEDVVRDCYGMGDEDPLIVKPRMLEARRREQIALGTRSRWDTLVPVGL